MLRVAPLCLRVFLVCTSLLGVCDAAHAQTCAEDPVPGPVTILKEAVKDLAGLASLDTVRVLGIGLGAALAIHPADSAVNRELTGSDYRFLAPGRGLGYAGVQAGSAVAAYAWGLAAGHNRTACIGQNLIRAQLVTHVATFALKETVRRERPDGSNRRSFPSGHASATFATATVLSGHFGWRVSVPAYVAATYVAASRLHHNRHKASDVVFGAALGVAAGRVTLRREKKSRVIIQPVVVADGGGLVIRW